MTDGMLPSAVEKLKLEPHLEDEINNLRQELFEYRTLRVPVDFLLKVELESYLRAAVFQAAAIHESQVQDWKTPAWDFGRFAKAHPSLIDLRSGPALQRVKESIGAAFWSEHLKMDPTDAEMAFDAIWNGCKSIPGYDHLTAAITRAKGEVQGSISNSPAGYDLFLAVARYLQEVAGEKPFPLPVHTFASRLSCQPMTISRYRKKAIRDGHLLIVNPHSYRAGGKCEATEFRYITPSENRSASSDD